VTSKLRAQRSKEIDRISAYRQIFTAKDSGKPALVAIDKARMGRFSGMTLEGAHAFAIGTDFSFCVWDTRNTRLLTVDGSLTQ
jgi:hypothetical protein